MHRRPTAPQLIFGAFAAILFGGATATFGLPTPPPVPSATAIAQVVPTTPTPSPPSVSPPPSTPPPVATPTVPPSPPPSTPAFFAPPPNPLPIVAMPERPVPASPSSAPSWLYVQQITPVIQVWRASALTPELPSRRGKQVGPIAIPINEVVTMRLRFGLVAVGKSVVVTASAGVILDPPQQLLAIQPSADCVVSVSLSDGYSDGAIRFYCEGISTTLTLSRFVPAAQPLSQRSSNGVKR
jgi:hypothetical protein